METIHIENKKKLTEKTLTDEIKKILLIDHNKDSGLSAALAQEGYDVIHCDTVQKAWCLVYPQRPDLIIIHLDNLDGAGFADFQECRALAEGVPIILATSAEVNRTLMKSRIERSRCSRVPQSLPASRSRTPKPPISS